MKKLFFSIIIAQFLLFIKTSVVKASLLIIKKDGEIVWNVLSEEAGVSLEIPRHSFLEVKEAADTRPATDAFVSLTKDGGKVNLVVLSENEMRELDVSGVSDDLVEIEERAEVQKIVIGVSDDMFSLEQKGVKALTDFPIDIDTKTAELSVKTPSGNRFLSILPFQAVEILLRSKLLNEVADNKIEIIESQRELQYQIKGEGVLDFFGIFSYPVSITGNVSASTGEILTFEAPVWYKMVVHLLT
jgi:hypothetical protein